MPQHPDDVVRGYLGPDEHIVFDQRPDLRAWLLDQTTDYLAMGLTTWIVIATPVPLVRLLGLVGLGLMLAWLGWRLLGRRYTRYVLTDHRVIRVSGVLRRDHEWIAWRKVTDVSVHRGVVDRIIGTATIRIQSANEQSGFAAMTDVPNPLRFAELITTLVNQRQGPVDLPVQ